MNPAPVRFPSSTVLCFGVALLSGLLCVPLPAWLSSPGGVAFQAMGHFVVFVLLLTLVYVALLRVRPNARGWALLLAIPLTAAIGGASEWAQTFSTRTASWQDFQMDLMGVAAGAATIVGGWLRGSRLFFYWLVPVIGAWTVPTFLVTRSAVSLLRAGHHQSAAFPQLGDFEEGWERILWEPQGSGGDRPTRATFHLAHPTHGRQSLQIEAGGSTWAGVRVLIRDPLPWPESRLLRFDVFNPGDAFKLGIRVDGIEGDRFTGELHIAPGLNQCRVPPAALANRDSNLSQPATFAAKTIIFHLGASPAKRTFYLDNVRLE